MKAAEVLKILRIHRNTLSKYVKNGTISVSVLPNGKYDYDENSVYAFLNKDIPRKKYIYARVSTIKQKHDLENQILLVKTYCVNKGIRVDGIYSDIASGINYDKRKEFFILLDEILSNRVDTVIISSKDRMSRIGFSLIENLFNKFGTKIEVIDCDTNIKTDSEEIFEEIIILLHSFAMKYYSNRRLKDRIKEQLSECN